MEVHKPQCQLVKTIEASKRKTDEHELLVKREDGIRFLDVFHKKKVAFRPSAILILGKNEFYEHGFRSAGMIYYRNICKYYTLFYSIYIYSMFVYIYYIYMYVCIYIYIWVCDCECKCDPHKLGHIISVYATMAHYGYISTEVEPHGLWVLGQLWELTRIVLGAANVTHNKTNLLSKTVTKWSQTCGNTVDIDILENGMRLSFFTTTIVKPTNPSKNEQYLFSTFSTIYEKSIGIKKLGVCVCGKIASRYFSEYFQT